MSDKISVLVDGGKATGGPPLGPALGPLGVNIGQVVKAINEQTKAYEGMKVPVIVEVSTDKTFTVSVGTPPASALIKKEMGVEIVKEGGDITFDKILKVAKLKQGSMNASDLKHAVKEVMGTCVSMRIRIDGKSAKEALAAVDKGEYDPKIK